MNIEEVIEREGQPHRDNLAYSTETFVREVARHHYMRLWDRMISLDTVRMVKRLSAHCTICVYDRHTCLINDGHVIAYQNRHKDIVLDINDGPTRKKGILQDYVNEYGSFLGNDVRLYWMKRHANEGKWVVGIMKDYFDGIVI